MIVHCDYCISNYCNGHFRVRCGVSNVGVQNYLDFTMSKKLQANQPHIHIKQWGQNIYEVALKNLYAYDFHNLLENWQMTREIVIA